MMNRATFSAPLCATALLALVAVSFGEAQAQSAVITGKVTGRQGEALGGAIVVIDEFSAAVATTTQGTYTLTLAPERTKGQTVTLRARYIGYSPGVKQVTLTPGTQTQDFELKFDPMTLDAVVVTGVAEATEAKKLTFAVGHVDAQTLNQAPGVSALGALEGKVAGARLLSGSGMPGGEPTIRLRSATSLTSPSACGGATCASTDVPGPLLIVDGTITRHGLSDINSEDIERVEVVKGAAASSLYGSDAANGVVQIFTKRGERIPDGKLSVTVRNEYGQSFRPKSIPTAMAYPYLTDTLGTYTDANGNTVTNGAYIDASGKLIASTAQPSEKADGIADIPYARFNRPVYDQQARLLTHGPFYTNYISVGQRRGNTNFNVSFQNTKQDGVLILLNGYNRQNFRVNVDQALTPRFDVSVGGFFGKSNNNQVTEGPGSPFFAVTFIEPNIDLFAKNPDGSPYAAKIPHLLPNASNPLYRLANEHINTDRSRYTGYAKATYRVFDWLSLEGNYNYDQESANYTQERPKNYLNSSGLPTSGFDVNDRYLIDGLVRWDGSSLFGPDSRWQTYYRASGAYRVTQDVHIKGIDELKVRASYGTAGLRPTFSAQYETFSVVGGVPVKQTLGNRALKPARSGELELGGNVDFLGRFTLEDSYSRKETKDQILLVPLSSATGYVNQWKNAGTLLGHTHELALGAIILDRPDFSWRLNIAGDRTRQKITALASDVPPFLVGPDYAGNNDVTQHFKIAAGETFGVIYGTKIVRTAAELCDSPDVSKAAGTTPCLTYAAANYIVNEDGYLVANSTYHTKNEAYIKYVDPTGNSLVKIADVNPDFNLSFTTNLRFKNFSAYALVDWVQGGKIYNGTRQWPFFELRDRVYDQSGKPRVNCAGTTDPDHCPYSTGKKSDTYYQAVYNGINPIDFFVENGTYVKIKEINVSYNIGRGLLEKIGIGGVNGAQIGGGGRNPFTLSKDSGYDPPGGAIGR